MHCWSVGARLVTFVAAVSVAYTPDAWAGCPNPCKLTVSPARVTPALPCASIESRHSDCDCGMELLIQNRCDHALEAVGFSFRACWEVSGASEPCTALEPGRLGRVSFPLTTRGDTEEELVVRSAAGEHGIVLSADVHSFTEPGCSFAARSVIGDQPGLSAAALAACALAAAGWRRRRSRPRQ